ncbi:hypothetical protein SEVIR_9G136502v4 [Setaria viridis]
MARDGRQMSWCSAAAAPPPPASSSSSSPRSPPARPSPTHSSFGRFRRSTIARACAPLWTPIFLSPSASTPSSPHAPVTSHRHTRYDRSTQRGCSTSSACSMVMKLSLSHLPPPNASRIGFQRSASVVMVISLASAAALASGSGIVVVAPGQESARTASSADALPRGTAGRFRWPPMRSLYESLKGSVVEFGKRCSNPGVPQPGAVGEGHHAGVAVGERQRTRSSSEQPARWSLMVLDGGLPWSASLGDRNLWPWIAIIGLCCRPSCGGARRRARRAAGCTGWRSGGRRRLRTTPRRGALRTLPPAVARAGPPPCPCGGEGRRASHARTCRVSWAPGFVLLCSGDW